MHQVFLSHSGRDAAYANGLSRDIENALAKHGLRAMEIRTGLGLARGRRRPFFFPCVALGARIDDLPSDEAQLAAVDLATLGGQTRLVEGLCMALVPNPVI